MTNHNEPRTAPWARRFWAPHTKLPADLQKLKDALIARTTNVQHVPARDL